MNVAHPPKKKGTLSDILRGYGMPESVVRMGKAGLRYKSPIEKGVLWYFVSFYVRLRDVNKYGVCISCGRSITFDSCDAGHFMPAKNCGLDLLFDLGNVNAECSYCNAWDEAHLLGYADNLDKRYGPGTAAELRKRRDDHLKGPAKKDWSPSVYEEKIKELRLWIKSGTYEK